jgi:hypothetical protein
MLKFSIDDLMAIADYVQKHVEDPSWTYPAQLNKDPPSLLKHLTILRSRIKTESDTEHQADADILRKLLKALYDITDRADWIRDGGEAHWPPRPGT